MTKIKPLTITVKRRAYGVAATARKIGCHPNHLSYILHGQRVPNDTLRRRLVAELKRRGIKCRKAI